VDVPDDSIPKYAILSHTWSQDEVSFQDLERLASGWLSSYEHIRNKVRANKRLSKVIGAATLAARNGYSYIWMDTCCIDKTSSAELSEAINSMYRWYEQSAVCYVYLSDVAPVAERGLRIWDDAELERSNFRQSRWFTRGWTLQELIAPKDVRFYAQDWSYIGSHKKNIYFRHLLSRITGIDERVLDRSLSPRDLSVSTRMKWAALRQTTRPEDIAYCLMGLFGVNMPLLYGEGKRAFIRLQDEILKETDDQSLFAWTSQLIESPAVDSLRGLLAESPLEFKDVGNLRPLPPLLTRDSVPSSITNQGLRIQLYLSAVGVGDQNSVEEDYHAILDCSHRDGHHEYCPTIYLRRLWGDQFARVRPHECVLLPPPADDVLTSHKGYQTVFIRQRPVYIMPEFTLPTGDVPLPVTIGESGGYRLQGVYPPERWDSSSLSLKSIHSQLDRVMGIFRFSHPLKSDLHVDVAVGLRRVSQRRWESWCSQQRCRGDPLNRIFRSFDQMLRDPNHRIRLTGSSFNYEQSFGQDYLLESQAKVIETQLHGRSYITLYVFSKPEICTARELQSLPTAGIPRSYAVDNSMDLNDEVRRLTMACSVQDAVELSIFPATELNTKVRTNPETLEPTNVCIGSFNLLLSSIPPNKLRVRNPIKGNLSQSVEKLSTDLLYACKEGDYRQVERLIRTEALIEGETENFHSFRPLHWATVGGHLSIIRLLLSRGAQDYSRTSQDWTAVHLAAMMGHLDIITFFFEKAAHTGVSIQSLVDAKTRGTLETPFHLAASYVRPRDAEQFFNTLYSFSGHTDGKIFPANYLDETPLHRAAAMDNAGAVRRILKQTEQILYDFRNLHPVDKFGRSPLWHAACGGSSDSIRALDSYGPNLHLADDYGRTPLDAACREGRASAVRTLLDLGASSNCVSHPLGLTPCHYAALFGHSRCICSLIEYNADPDAGTTRGAYFKPIHLAAANGWLQCVVDLCAAGANPDSPSTHYILVEADGTSVSLIARQTQSAEEIALLQGHFGIVEFLKKRKVQQETQSQEMITAVQRKSSRQRDSVMDLGTLEGDPTSLISLITGDEA
jgi:ankyrin repeat protein